MNGEVMRHKWIKVEAMNLKGKKFKKKFTGFEARLFQHEYDHLEGVVYIDHLDEEDMEEVRPPCPHATPRHATPRNATPCHETPDPNTSQNRHATASRSNRR
jgi:hypothetical protein